MPRLMLTDEHMLAQPLAIIGGVLALWLMGHSLNIILALFPAALGLGAGAETNGPLSVAGIGGMITSTLLTLVVVPAVYSLAMHGEVVAIR